jgi:hypothetical protein
LLDANNIRHEEQLPPLQQFTYTDFISFVSMLETDYFCGIKCQSPYILFHDFVINDLNIYKLLQYIDDVNRTFIEKHRNCIYVVPDNFFEQWLRVKSYYEEAQVVDPSKVNKVYQKPNRTSILQILCDECDFELSEVEQMISELEEFHYCITHQNMLHTEQTSHTGPQRSTLTDHTYDSFGSYQAKYSRRIDKHASHNKKTKFYQSNNLELKT